MQLSNITTAKFDAFGGTLFISDIFNVAKKLDAVSCHYHFCLLLFYVQDTMMASIHSMSSIGEWHIAGRLDFVY